MSKDNLGDRVKNLYENAYRNYLPGRMPVVCRVDGKSFHTLTKNCKRPFDDSLSSVMNDVAIYLCKNMQNAMMAYVQSDEISILLNNYKELNTESWFQNNIQKMSSVSAGMASAVFTSLSPKIFGSTKTVIFDSRVFVLPKEEVNNYFIFRQNDATRNSVQMVARSLYSHKELNNKNSLELKELIKVKDQDWNKYPISQKRGRCIVKEKYMNGDVERSRWIVDEEIPIFHEDHNYIEKFIS